MSLTPLTRENMREIKARKDEELNKIKRANIDSVVKEIYMGVLKFAEVSELTRYKLRINTPYGIAGMSKEFTIAHMKEILKGLQTLFPDSSVEYKKETLLREPSSTEYNDLMNEIIVIDWT